MLHNNKNEVQKHQLLWVNIGCLLTWKEGCLENSRAFLKTGWGKRCCMQGTGQRHLFHPGIVWSLKKESGEILEGRGAVMKRTGPGQVRPSE